MALRKYVLSKTQTSTLVVVNESWLDLQGVLLVGFTLRDSESVQTWFDGIEQGLKIACCQNQHLSRSMDDIFSSPHGLLQHDCLWEEQIEPVPRAVIFSGMTQKEMLGIAEFWSLSGTSEMPLFMHSCRWI